MRRAALVLGLLLVSAPLARATVAERIVADSTAAAALLDRSQPDSARAVVDALLPAARAAGDSALVARSLLMRAMVEIRLTRADVALPLALQAERLAQAARDTASWMLSLRAQSMARNLRGDLSYSDGLARKWMDLAQHTGSAEYLGWGHTMFGWLAIQRGDRVSARHELQKGVALFEGIGHPVGLPYSLNLLGTIDLAEGKFEAARADFERVLGFAERFRNLRLQAYAYNNLGAVERAVGDPGKSLVYYRRATALHRRTGELASELLTRSNLSGLELDLGHLEAARRSAEEALAVAESTGQGAEIPWQRVSLADALRASGRREAAKAAYRRVWTDESAVPDVRALAGLGLGGTLADQDSLAEALTVWRSTSERFASKIEQDARAKLALGYADGLARAGFPAQAARTVLPLAAQLEATGDIEYSLGAWSQAARAARRLGEPAQGENALAHASALWETGRRRVADIEFREMRGEQAKLLVQETVAHTLTDPAIPARDCARLAFERAQRFKTRTLLERMCGPQAFSDTAASALESRIELATFQSHVLRPGEVFLDYVFGPDTIFAFAVTPTQCRVAGLPVWSGPFASLELARDLVSQPPAAGGDTTAAWAAANTLGRWLLGAFTHELSSSNAVLVAADGPLHRVPFAALVPPGDAAPLGVTHLLSSVSSAHLLAAVRGREARAGARLLASAGAAPRPGAALRGAASEVRDLAWRYDGVRTLEPDPEGRLPLSGSAMAGYAGLHLAGHTHADDQLPWRSGIVIGPATTEEESLLTAAQIASQKLDASLVVLSGCESAGGRARSGEGVSGLASAFLVAGAPAVVATLWPVDDRVTARLMERFYDRLAAGHGAAMALREAQASVRANRHTAHPFYWAGFVLVGDPGAHLKLRRRIIPPARQTAGIVLLVCGLFSFIAIRRAVQKNEARPT